eukprot:gb/GEZN01006861.1/.p1 GENE.gb/GEZN01006861.1/~~gb/GEZN01006861.1/.p1  ORF type:complete len:407 (+),score=15.41 gb/GEZN01006861.1/:382-1602(+)
MSNYDSNQALGPEIAIFCCAICSVFGSSGIIYCIRFQKRESQGTVQEVLLTAVTNMVYCDMMVSLWLMTCFAPAFGNTIIYNGASAWRVGFCAALGFWVQFFILSSLNWFFVIINLTLAVLSSVSTDIIERSARWQHVFVWTLSLTFSVIALFEGILGQAENPHSCWIKDPLYNMLLLYLPCLFYVICAISLLLYTIYVAKRRLQVQIMRMHCMPWVTTSGPASSSASYIVTRIMMFVVSFVCVWFFPLLDRFLPSLIGKDSPPWLQYAHFIALALSGTSNAVVWATSKPLRKIVGGQDSSVTSQQDTYRNNRSATQQPAEDQLRRSNATINPLAHFTKNLMERYRPDARDFTQSLLERSNSQCDPLDHHQIRDMDRSGDAISNHDDLLSPNDLTQVIDGGPVSQH